MKNLFTSFQVTIETQRFDSNGILEVKKLEDFIAFYISVYFVYRSRVETKNINSPMATPPSCRQQQ